MLRPSALRFYRGALPPLPPRGRDNGISLKADVNGGPGGRRAKPSGSPWGYAAK